MPDVLVLCPVGLRHCPALDVRRVEQVIFLGLFVLAARGLLVGWNLALALLRFVEFDLKQHVTSTARWQCLEGRLLQRMFAALDPRGGHGRRSGVGLHDEDGYEVRQLHYLSGLDFVLYDEINDVQARGRGGRVDHRLPCLQSHPIGIQGSCCRRSSVEYLHVHLHLQLREIADVFVGVCLQCLSAHPMQLVAEGLASSVCHLDLPQGLCS